MSACRRVGPGAPSPSSASAGPRATRPDTHVTLLQYRTSHRTRVGRYSPGQYWMWHSKRVG
eukprot:2213440-Rhodomonas_salina.1